MNMNMIEYVNDRWPRDRETLVRVHGGARAALDSLEFEEQRRRTLLFEPRLLRRKMRGGGRASYKV